MTIHEILDLPPATTDEELTSLLSRFFPATRPAKALTAVFSSFDDDPGIAAAMAEVQKESDPALVDAFKML
jgi:hypothetical protein